MLASAAWRSCRARSRIASSWRSRSSAISDDSLNRPASLVLMKPSSFATVACAITPPHSSPRISFATCWVMLSAVLSITQQVANEILGEEWGGVIAQATVAKELGFISTKLAGLFSLSSEIAEDLERQEDAMRDRALQLRQAADASMI